jgi:hypothetical protein
VSVKGLKELDAESTFVLPDAHLQLGEGFVRTHRTSMAWAQRLKRVFNIDIEICEKCGGDVRIIATIEDLIVIGKILTHLNDKVSSVAITLLPECRAPPLAKLFKDL